MDTMPNSTPKQDRYDAIVIGSGPNGLSAAIRLAQEGKSVLVVERADEPGGGTRTSELTLPGFHHDVCSTAHPMGLASPYLGTLPLEKFGLEWIQPELPMAQTLDPAHGHGDAVALFRSVEETAEQFSSQDAAKYRSIFGPIVRDLPKLFGDLLGPAALPRHPIAVTRFGLQALTPASFYSGLMFDEEPAKTLFLGNAAHSIVPLTKPFTSAIGLMLQSAAHGVGWPVAKGGSKSIWKAMVACLENLGGEVCTGIDVGQIEELPKADSILFDTSPSAMVKMTGDRLPAGYKRRLLDYHHGPGVFKLDLALSEPIPWISDICRRAGTIHLSGGADETVASEAALYSNHPVDKPFQLVAQPATFDPSRAPKGKHIAWTYCHVPPGWDGDATEPILNQIERFAPGFRDTILATNAMSCADMERYNPNYIGGDIACGASDFTQLLTRPIAKLDPYSTPDPGIFLCSAATPPGAGVHGMCGYHAAQSVLKKER